MAKSTASDADKIRSKILDLRDAVEDGKISKEDANEKYEKLKDELESIYKSSEGSQVVIKAHNEAKRVLDGAKKLIDKLDGSGDNGKWVTIGGRRVFIAEGETLKGAIEKKYGK